VRYLDRGFWGGGAALCCGEGEGEGRGLDYPESLSVEIAFCPFSFPFYSFSIGTLYPSHATYFPPGKKPCLVFFVGGVSGKLGGGEGVGWDVRDKNTVLDFVIK